MGGPEVSDTSAALAAIPGKYAQPDEKTLATLPKGGANLAYMGHAEVTLALIDIDPHWTWEPLAIVDGLPVIVTESNRYVMWARLTVLGKTVLGVGTCELRKGDPEKELVGDFLRNAAMRLGIGTKLWSKATDADPAGRSEQAQARRPVARPAQPTSSPHVPPAPERPKGDVTDAQIRKLMACFGERNIKEKAARLAYIVAVVDRDIESSKELTRAEAAKVIDALEAATAAVA